MLVYFLTGGKGKANIYLTKKWLKIIKCQLKLQTVYL